MTECRHVLRVHGARRIVRERGKKNIGCHGISAGWHVVCVRCWEIFAPSQTKQSHPSHLIEADAMRVGSRTQEKP